MTEMQILKERLKNEKDVNNLSICCIEELSEVTKVLTKYIRESEKYSKEGLTEEVAHALLMLNTVKNKFGLIELSNSSINNVKMEKNILAIYCIEKMSKVTNILAKYLSRNKKIQKKDLSKRIAKAQLSLDTVISKFELNETEIEQWQLSALKKGFSIS